MPSIQSVILTDRQTVPVNHTMVPVNPDANGVWLLEKANSTPVGSPQLTISSRRNGGRYRARIVLKVPTVQDETVNGIVKPVVIRTGFAELSFTFDLSSTVDERKNIIGMIQSALKTDVTLIDDALTSMQGIH